MKFYLVELRVRSETWIRYGRDSVEISRTGVFTGSLDGKRQRVGGDPAGPPAVHLAIVANPLYASPGFLSLCGCRTDRRRKLVSLQGEFAARGIHSVLRRRLR